MKCRLWFISESINGRRACLSNSRGWQMVSTLTSPQIFRHKRSLCYRSYLKSRHSGSINSTRVKLHHFEAYFLCYVNDIENKCSLARKVLFLRQNARNIAENVMSVITKSCKFHHKFILSSVSAMMFCFGVTSDNSKHIYMYLNKFPTVQFLILNISAVTSANEIKFIFRMWVSEVMK